MCWWLVFHLLPSSVRERKCFWWTTSFVTKIVPGLLEFQDEEELDEYLSIRPLCQKEIPIHVITRHPIKMENFEFRQWCFGFEL